MYWVPIGQQNPSIASVSVSILCFASDRKMTKTGLSYKKKRKFIVSYNWLPVRLDSGLTDVTRPSFPSLSFATSLVQVGFSLRQALPHGPIWLPPASHFQSREGLWSILIKPHWEWRRGKFFYGKLGRLLMAGEEEVPWRQLQSKDKAQGQESQAGVWSHKSG